MKGKPLKICEAAKFCTRKFNSIHTDNVHCSYIMPYHPEHRSCTNCSHIRSTHKHKVYNKYNRRNMWFIEYIPGETVLAETLEQLNEWREGGK